LRRNDSPSAVRAEKATKQPLARGQQNIQSTYLDEPGKAFQTTAIGSLFIWEPKPRLVRLFALDFLQILSFANPVGSPVG